MYACLPNKIILKWATYLGYSYMKINAWEIMKLKLGGQVLVSIHTIPDLRCLLS